MGTETKIASKPGNSTPTTAPTFSAVWAHYSAIRCTKIAECICSGSPTIGQLSRQYGQEAVRACIEGHIVGLRDFLNLRAVMTQAQARETAELAVDEFKNLNISDIVLIFRRAKLGHWGEFYGRLDGQMILGWFGKYFDERVDESAKISEQEAHSLKDRDSRILNSEQLQRLYGEHWTQKIKLADCDKDGNRKLPNELPPLNERTEKLYASIAPFNIDE